MSVVTRWKHSLVPATAYELDRVLYRSREMWLVLIVPGKGTRFELVPLEADSSAVVAFVEIVVFVAVAAAAEVDSGGVGGPNRSVMMRGTSIEGFGS